MIREKRTEYQVYTLIAIEVVTALILAVVVGGLSNLDKSLKTILGFVSIMILLLALVEMIVLIQHRKDVPTESVQQVSNQQV